MTSRLKAVFIAVLFLSAVGIRGQATGGLVQGQVMDKDGQPIIGALVELTGPGLPEPLHAVTDVNGGFVVSALPAGTDFQIKVEAEGYNTVVLHKISVTTDVRTKLSVTMGGGGTSVTVTAAPPSVGNREMETGASVFRLTNEALKVLPQGESTPLNQVILQAPGVAQDSFGLLHVRGDHANVQYRINGLVLPEGISGFGNALDTRFAQRLDFLTGALPAQYGFWTAGIVDITPKTGALEGEGDKAIGGVVDLYGGQRGTFQPSIDVGGATNDFAYLVTATSIANNLGIESPTSAVNPIHDHSTQFKGFSYFNFVLDPSLRLSVIVGNAAGEFQIPNNPGQAPSYNYASYKPSQLQTLYPSSELDQTQHEVNQYAIVALQGQPTTDLNYQVALFSRYSSVHYHPDPIGDLIYDGVSADVFRSDVATGLQGDATYKLGDHHTLGAGFFVNGEYAVNNNASQVFPADSSGAQTGDIPVTIVDNTSKRGWLYSLYVQDRWEPTPDFSLIYGARVDRVTAYVQGNQFSPRVIATYKVTPDLTLHAGYAHFFTPPALELIEPTSIAKFQNTTNQLPTTGNGKVEPERSDYFDVGGTYMATPRLMLGLDWYYKKVHDLLDEGQFGQALVFSPFNYQKGRVWGLEGTLQYRVGAFDMYTNAALAMAVGKDIVSGQFNFAADELAYIASNYVHLDHDQNVTLSGGMSYGWQAVTVSLDGIYGSGLRSGFANTKSLPGYLQLNLGLSGTIPSKRLGPFTWRASVVNLLDKIYEIRDGTGIGVGAPQYGPRRALYIGLSKRF